MQFPHNWIIYSTTKGNCSFQRINYSLLIDTFRDVGSVILNFLLFNRIKQENIGIYSCYWWLLGCPFRHSRRKVNIDYKNLDYRPLTLTNICGCKKKKEKTHLRPDVHDVDAGYKFRQETVQFSSFDIAIGCHRDIKPTDMKSNKQTR